MAPIFSLLPDMPPAVLEIVTRVVRSGGVLAIPTESSYGLGAAPLDERAVRRVCAIKDRPPDKPLLVLVADQAQLVPLVVGIPPAAQMLMDRFWPGPLTLVMRAASTVPRALTAGSGSVGVRQPAHPALLKLLQQVGPLTGTSANRSGQSPICTADEVQTMFGQVLDLILDGGTTPGGVPSTIVETLEPVSVLREGALPIESIRTSLAQAGIVLH